MDLGQENWKAQEDKSGIAWIKKTDFDKIAIDISKAKEEADVVIVSMHSGVEYVQELTSFQKELSRIAIDAGADLVIGHHPHVVQKYELYKGKYIFYSLGNFLFDQAFSEETMTGRIVKVIIKDKEIKTISIQESKQNESYQVYLVDKIQKVY
jgi:poly-gamma-glutamate synthesis protein (capsule biosynthesis protein)